MPGATRRAKVDGGCTSLGEIACKLDLAEWSISRGALRQNTAGIVCNLDLARGSVCDLNLAKGSILWGGSPQNTVGIVCAI